MKSTTPPYLASPLPFSYHLSITDYSTFFHGAQKAHCVLFNSIYRIVRPSESPKQPGNEHIATVRHFILLHSFIAYLLILMRISRLFSRKISFQINYEMPRETVIEQAHAFVAHEEYFEATCLQESTLIFDL